MKRKHCSFPEIGQYRSIVKTVRERAQYIGKDENGDAIFDESKECPIISFRGTTKLHGCFEKNTLVTLANGERIPISEIKKGYFVMSYDFKSKESIVAEVTNVFEMKSDKKWVELIFDDRTIKCTSDHRFYTKNRGFIEAENLTSDDEFILDF